MIEGQFDLSDAPMTEDFSEFEEYTEVTNNDVRPVTWDRRFLQVARLVATWSKDPNRKVGAVIVDHRKEIVALGYNGFPRQVYDEPATLADGDMKNAFTIHAEVNACLKLARPVPTGELILYCTSLPCSNCMAIVIQSGINTVVCPDDRRPDSKWAASWDYALDLAGRACVAVLFENELDQQI